MSDTKLSSLTDQQLLTAAYRQNADAVALANKLRTISHVIDDLIDHDKAIPDEAVFGAFWDVLVELPANPFYSANLGPLHSLVVASLLNWRIANTFERGGVEDRNMAHSLRYDLATVLIMIAYLIGGRAWAEAFGPEIRRRCQKQPLAEYVAECEKRFPANVAAATKSEKGGKK